MVMILRERLRRGTASAHARVDALFGSCDFATEHGYATFLGAQARAWETLRPMLDAASLERADALRRDLVELGLPVPVPWRDVALPHQLLLGHRYVLEGSRLGSAVLLRRLFAKAPAIAERASHYLTESEKIDRWKHLSTSLQKDDANPAIAEAVIEDALFVFDLFEKSLADHRQRTGESMLDH